MKDEELISRLLELDRAQKKEEPTFFEIIGRARDENLISRMLAYLLGQDPALCAALVRFYAERKGRDWEVGLLPFEVVCEKGMGSGRADIFRQNEAYTLTIENKVESAEHGNQTEEYCRVVTEQYRSTRNAFLYLKPDYNGSYPHCEAFAVMTYSELASLLESEEGFCGDFARHIRRYFIRRRGNLMESDELILQNYAALTRMLREAEAKYAEAKREVERALLSGELFGGAEIRDYREESREGVFVSDVTRDIWYRISKNKIWWGDANCDARNYYFYLELVMPEDPAEITTQMTVKCYGKGGKYEESLVRRFMIGKGSAMLGGQWCSKEYFVSSPRGKFSCAFPILSEDWKGALFTYIGETFREYYGKMEELFSQFTAWLMLQ